MINYLTFIEERIANPIENKSLFTEIYFYYLHSYTKTCPQTYFLVKSVLFQKKIDSWELLYFISLKYIEKRGFQAE